MIARSLEVEETLRWQAELRLAYRDPETLLAALGLSAADVPLARPAEGDFPFRVTRAFAARMRPGDARDPLLRQVLPLAEERIDVPGFGPDPVGELARHADGALLQKYAGRALIVLTGACAIHCRYCFRREFPYAASVGAARLAAAIARIAEDASVSEVILSGGDPLVLDDRSLRPLFEALAAISHVERVRVHTRLPIVLPSRMTSGLLELMSTQRYPTVLVVHANHPREIDAVTAAGLRRFRDAGITLLNQAVLLRGINDEAGTLAELSRVLFDCGVLPYYVHALDRVRGAAHFEVPEATAIALEEALRASLPGYLVPRFVREVAGAVAKLPLHALRET